MDAVSWIWINTMSLFLSGLHSMEFDYLNEVPVLTMDVNEEFKGNNNKRADMIEKVSDTEAFLKIWNGCVMLQYFSQVT